MKLRYLILIVFALVLYGCGGEEAEPVGPLPATESGSLTAIVDEEQWNTSGNINVFGVYRNSKLTLRAFRTLNNATDRISIHLTEPHLGMNELLDEIDFPDQSAEFLRGSDGEAFYVTQDHTGFVNLTEFDTNGLRMSGTFEFSGQSNAFNEISITNGSFENVVIQR